MKPAKENEILRVTNLAGEHLFQLVHGDITREAVDAIVNAANKTLQHGGGVALAIARRGGRIIQQQSNAWVRKYGPVTHNRPAVTDSGTLPCQFVLHAVGPIWGEGDESQKLAAAITGCLETASELGLHSIALPAISTGVYHFPVARAAGIFYHVIPAYFTGHPDSPLTLVKLVLYDKPTLAVFLKLWKQNLPPIDNKGGEV